jgi:hypothetical protein
MRLLQAVLLACCQALLAAQQDVVVPEWHPHHPHHRGDTGGFRSRLGCGHLTTPQFVRRLCFGPLLVLQQGSADAPALVAYNLTVVALDCLTQNCVRQLGFKPACGDSLRVNFASPHIRLAPDAGSLRELACGVHALTLSVPRGASAELFAEVTLLHVSALPGTVLNAPVRIPGVVRLPPTLVADEEDDLVEAPGGVGSGYFGVASGEWTPYGEPPTPGDAYVAVPAWPRAALCDSPSAPGRWTATHALYPPSGGELGEPWAWRPHACVYPRITGVLLATCLRRGGDGAPRRWFFQGGAQARQLHAAFVSHTLNETYFWPGSRIAAWNVEPEIGSLRELADGSLLYAASEGVAGAPLPPLAADAWVLSYGLGDALAGAPLERFAAALEKWLGQLADARATAPRPPALLWITAPAVVYKQPGLAGEASCTALGEGKTACMGVPLASFAAGRGGEVNWTMVPLGQPVPGSSLATTRSLAADVRAFNAAAVAAVRARFPDAHVLDVEALTEALPGDYSFDGLRWGCDDADHALADATLGPYRCRALVNSVTANIIAATLCRD